MDQARCEILAQAGWPADDIAAMVAEAACVTPTADWDTWMRWPLLQSTAADNAALMGALDAIAAQCGAQPYTVRMLYLLEQLPMLQAAYREHAIPERYIVDLARGLYSKLNECVENWGCRGTHCMDYHLPFYRLQRFALGRLEYENRVYPWETRAYGPFTVRTGDAIHGMHIPSGRPLSRDARMDSYRKAFAFFGCTADQPLIVCCGSWLLNPDHRKMLPAGANIVDFLGDFDLVQTEPRPAFPDAWRLFGPAAREPLDRWPTDNALRKGYVALLRAGGQAQNGCGLLIFDGARVLTRQTFAESNIKGYCSALVVER